jgi:hypothetical protein
VGVVNTGVGVFVVLSPCIDGATNACVVRWVEATNATPKVMISERTSSVTHYSYARTMCVFSENCGLSDERFSRQLGRWIVSTEGR